MSVTYFQMIQKKNKTKQRNKWSERIRENIKKDNDELKAKEEEIKDGNKILGLEDVTGPGVIIKITEIGRAHV